MSENVTNIIFKLYHDGDTAGTLDCQIQEPGKGVISFDPTQLDKKLKEVLGKVTAAAVVKAEQAAAERDEAVAAFEAVQGADIAALQADVAAKDANIQALLEVVNARPIEQIEG